MSLLPAGGLGQFLLPELASLSLKWGCSSFLGVLSEFQRPEFGNCSDCGSLGTWEWQGLEVGREDSLGVGQTRLYPGLGPSPASVTETPEAAAVTE